MSFKLSAHQLAIANEKRLPRQAKKLNQQRNTEDADRKPHHLARPWVSLLNPTNDEASVVKVMTWNVRASLLMMYVFKVYAASHLQILAQCLVRRLTFKLCYLRLT